MNLIAVQRVHTWPPAARHYYLHDSFSVPSNRRGRSPLGVAWMPVFLYDDHPARVEHSINLVNDWYGDAPSVGPEFCSATPVTAAWPSSRNKSSNQGQSQITKITVSGQRMGDHSGTSTDRPVSQEAPLGNDDGCLSQMGLGFQRYSASLSDGARSSTTHSSLSLRSKNTYLSRPPTQSEGSETSTPTVYPWSRPFKGWIPASPGAPSSHSSSSERNQTLGRPVFHVRSKDVEKSRADAQLAVRLFNDDPVARPASPTNKRKRDLESEADSALQKFGEKGTLCSNCKRRKADSQSAHFNDMHSGSH